MVDIIGGKPHNNGFKPSLIWTPTTITPQLCWLSSMHNRIDLTQKAFLPANQEHKNEHEECNMKLQIYKKFFKVIGGSSVDSKGLVDTYKEDQELGLQFTTIDLDDTSAKNNAYFRRNQRTQQNINPNKCNNGELQSLGYAHLQTHPL